MSARILVVDDQPLNVKLLEAMLAAEYYTVLTAADGPEDLTEILSWLDDYCESKPVHGFDQAVYEFIDEHYPKRVKRATGRGRR